MNPFRFIADIRLGKKKPMTIVPQMTPAEVEPIPLTPAQVVVSQAQELKEHEATGQTMTYVPEPAALAAAKVEITPQHVVIPEPAVIDTTSATPVAAVVEPSALAHVDLTNHDYLTDLQRIQQSYSSGYQMIAPLKTSPAAVAAQPKETLVATAPVVKETLAQEIGGFFKKVISTAAKDFSWVVTEIGKFQPIISDAEVIAGAIPGGAPVSAAIALGDSTVSGIAQTISNALNTLEAANVSTTSLTPAVISSLAAQVEQTLMNDPAIAKMIAAVGGTPTNLTAFNAELSTIAAAAVKLLVAI